MSTLQDAPALVYRTIVAGVIAYFFILTYATIVGDQLAVLVSNALFGLIAVGIGGVLYAGSSKELDPMTAAATCLMTGGVTQLLSVVTQIPELDLLASVTVFAGVIFYVYAVYR